MGSKYLWIVGTFAAMYLIATVLGFATYLLISPVVMWICVFTIMPVISTSLIYWYLGKMRIDRQASLAAVLHLAVVWIALSFGLDACTYIFILPAVSHTTPNWAFFRYQSPWIWLSYSVLLLSAWAAHALHRRRSNA